MEHTRTFIRLLAVTLVWWLHQTSLGHQVGDTFKLKPSLFYDPLAVETRSTRQIARVGDWNLTQVKHVRQSQFSNHLNSSGGLVAKALKLACGVQPINTTADEVVCDCSNLNLTNIPTCTQLPVECTKISVLKLTGNSIRVIDPGAFEKFPNMIVLDISGNPLTEQIRDGTFRGLTKLEKLVMVSNEEKPFIRFRYSDNTFSELNRLKYLDISTRNSNISQLFHQTLYSLSPGIKTFRANSVNKENYVYEMSGYILTLSNKTSYCFHHTKLTTLYLDGNAISIIKASFLTNLRHLEYLSLRANFLDGERGFIFDLPLFLSNLTFFDVGSQHTKGSVPYDDSLEEPIQPWKIISRSNFSERECISNSSSDDIFDFLSFPILPRLQTFRLDHIPYKMAIDMTKCRKSFKYNHVVNLDVSFWWITHIKGTIPCAFHLKYLNIRGISALSVDPKAFHEMPALERLVMSKSVPATAFEDNTFTEQIFLKNKNLRYIDISDSEIQLLKPSLISHLSKLHTLNVSRNKLSNVANIFSDHTSVQMIDISFNQLSIIPIKLLNILEEAQFKQETNISLDISGNPFICSCDSINLLHRFISSNIKIINLQSDLLYCTLFDGKKRNFTDSLNLLKSQCYKEDPTFIIVEFSFYILTLMITSCVCLVYRYRWTLKYFLYMVLGLANRGRHINENFRFDAFIAYCSKDEGWVMNELVRHLEEGGKNNQYKLCLHYRHFLPGRGIADNIVSAVQSSRTVVMVVTKDYLKSGWCKFETRSAHQHHLQKHGGGVIAIVHPEVRRLLHGSKSTVDAILESVTYLEWPTKNTQKLFWMRLKRAIGPPMVQPYNQHDCELILT